MQQYREIKSHHHDAILFFRMGDFYEMFFDDAELASRLLNIALTSRGDGVPLAGVPVKAAADYLRQLVAQGHRVANEDGLASHGRTLGKRRAQLDARDPMRPRDVRELLHKNGAIPTGERRAPIGERQ